MNAFAYTNSKGTQYYLHTQEVKLKGSGKVQRIYYFAKEIDQVRAQAELPTGYQVLESQKTGLPVLKKNG